MFTTPKKTIKISHSKSQAPLRPTSTFPQPRPQSTHKPNPVAYKTLLNKMLTLTSYDKFLKIASIFISKQILLCKKQPNQQINNKNSRVNSLYYGFVYDGRFLRKLAELSGDRKAVWRNFGDFIRVNKEVLREYVWGKDGKDGGKEGKEGDEGQVGYGEKRETQEEREFRLYGFSRKKQDENKRNQNVIVFSQFIKSNQQWHKSYTRATKQRQQRLSHRNQHSSPKSGSPNLKRIDPNEYRRKYKISPKPKKHRVVFFPEALDLLNPVQKQIVTKFPRLKYLLIGKDREHQVIAKLGEYRGWRVTMVGAEVQSSFQCEEFFDEDFQQVIKIEPLEPTAPDNNQQGTLDSIEQNKYLYYMHKYDDSN